MRHVSVAIPSNESFLTQWNPWIHSKVAKHFKRDKERILDSVQNVRLRLLSKDFISRWFLKHLKDEIVDLSQAQRILGGAKVTFISSIPSIDEIDPSCNNPSCIKRRKKGHGCSRSCEKSLWRISDLLKYAKFDFVRYFYSPQNHTISSSRVLRLIGYSEGITDHVCNGEFCQVCKEIVYPPEAYSVLESLYRQGRIKPSELTEHYCDGSASCSECRHGRALLKSRHLSLADKWDDSHVAAAKLRWNDSQLIPFLRNYGGTNIVHSVPAYIMRKPDKSGRVLGIDAGLLKYVEIIISNEVVNDFKRISRSDDITSGVFNKGMGPEFSNTELVAFEGEENEEMSNRIFRDSNSLGKFESYECRRDVAVLINEAGLTDEERGAIESVELMEMTVRRYAEKIGVTVPRVHRARASAMRKLRSNIAVNSIAVSICDKHGCEVSDLSGPDLFGPCVRARTDVFSDLHNNNGMSVQAIATYFCSSVDRVIAAINRKCLSEMRV